MVRRGGDEALGDRKKWWVDLECGCDGETLTDRDLRSWGLSLTSQWTVGRTGHLGGQGDSHPQTLVCTSCCYVQVKSQGPELQWQETQLRKEEFTKDTRNKNDVTDAVWYHAISNIIILQRFYVTLAWFLLGLAFNISFEMFSLFLAPTKGRWETDS